MLVADMSGDEAATIMACCILIMKKILIRQPSDIQAHRGSINGLLYHLN